MCYHDGYYHHGNFKAGARDGVIVPDGRALVKFLTTEATEGEKKMKVEVHVYRGISEVVPDEHWGDFIDYEDTPFKVYTRDTREGEKLPKPMSPIVHEEMVGVEDGMQKWVKSIVCCK